MRKEFYRKKRRYVLILESDLFNAFIIYRYWFGDDNGRHGRKQEIFSDKELAEIRFFGLQKYLIRYGYDEKCKIDESLDDVEDLKSISKIKDKFQIDLLID